MPGTDSLGGTCGRSFDRGDVALAQPGISVETMKSPVNYSILVHPQVPASGVMRRMDDRRWYEDDLSTDEMAATVSVINAAVRARRTSARQTPAHLGSPRFRWLFLPTTMSQSNRRRLLAQEAP